jgi:hypothetical protein
MGIKKDEKIYRKEYWAYYREDKQGKGGLNNEKI